jgi:Fe-S-cluster containining protein
MADFTRDYPFRFRCRRSGNCCARPESVVRVSPADMTQIANHLRISEAAARTRFVATSGDRLIDGPGGRCPFLEDGQQTRCRIYAVRPQKCRSWPYWDEFLDNPGALREAARLCPGIELSNRPLYPGFDSADE